MVSEMLDKIPKDLIRARFAAQRLGLSERRLANMRSEGIGPPYYKRRRTVFYSMSELDEWQRQVCERIEPVNGGALL
jgi:hypothetical protein